MASPQASGLRRVVVAASDAAPAPAALSPYEVERAARVARNQQTMAALGVTKAAAALSAPAVWRRAKPGGGGGGGGERRAKRPVEAMAEPPARVSKRIRVRAGLAEPEPDGSASELDAGAEVEEDRPRMLTVDEYLERKGLPKGAATTQPRAAACTAARAMRVLRTPLSTASRTRDNIPRRTRRCAAVLASGAAR